MKKFYLFFSIILILSATIFIFKNNINFANATKQYNISLTEQTQYKNEVEQYINKQYDVTIKLIDNETLSAKKTYKKYLSNKQNKQEISEKILRNQENISSAVLSFYIDITDITNKYLPIASQKPQTDYLGDWYDFIYPILKYNKIKNADKLKELYQYSSIKEQEILNYIDKI